MFGGSYLLLKSVHVHLAQICSNSAILQPNLDIQSATCSLMCINSTDAIHIYVQHTLTKFVPYREYGCFWKMVHMVHTKIIVIQLGNLVLCAAVMLDFGD